jgi:hypothetical protein
MYMLTVFNRYYTFPKKISDTHVHNNKNKPIDDVMYAAPSVLIVYICYHGMHISQN